MTPFKTVLVASAILATGMLPAAAQTKSPSAGADVSAATHCKDAQGNVKLKTAANGMGTPTTSGNTKGNGTDRPMSGSGTTGSGSMSGSMSGSSAAAANLSPCK